MLYRMLIIDRYSYLYSYSSTSTRTRTCTHVKIKYSDSYSYSHILQVLVPVLVLVNLVLAPALPGAAIWCQTSWSTLVEATACCLSKPLPISNAGLLSIEPLETIFSEILLKIGTFVTKNMHIKMLFAEWWPFCSDLKSINVLLLISYSDMWLSGHYRDVLWVVMHLISPANPMIASWHGDTSCTNGPLWGEPP